MFLFPFSRQKMLSPNSGKSKPGGRRRVVIPRVAKSGTDKCSLQVPGALRRAELHGRTPSLSQSLATVPNRQRGEPALGTVPLGLQGRRHPKPKVPASN